MICRPICEYVHQWAVWSAGVYTHDGSCLLGTSVSQQIRVLANNDVPTGAAFIPLIVPVA